MKLSVKYLALMVLALVGLAPSDVWGNYYAELTIAKSKATTCTGDGTVWVTDDKSSTDRSKTTLKLEAALGADVNFWLFAEPNAASYLIGFADSEYGTTPNITVDPSTSVANAYKYTCAVSSKNKGVNYYKAFAIFGTKYACTLTQPDSGGTIAWASDMSPAPSNGTVYQIPGQSTTLKVKATPATGCEVNKWYVNGSEAGSGSTLNTTVSGASTVSVTFKTYYQVRAKLTAEPSEGGGIYISQGDQHGTPPKLFYGETDYSEPKKDTANMAVPFWCYAASSAGYLHVGWQTAAQKGSATLDAEAASYVPGVTNECTITRNTPSTPGTAEYNYYAVFAKEQSSAVNPVIGETTTLTGVSYGKVVDTGIATCSLSGTTLTLRGVSSGTTKVIVYQNGEWKYYNVIPLMRYYAKMTAQVNGGSGGKAYVSSSSTENVASYTTGTTTAGPLSATAQGASAAVGNFYYWAMPDFGYKFDGWNIGMSKKITITNAHNTAAVTINSSATSSASAETKEYKANFSDVSGSVKDIYLAVGDKVQLFFYNTSYAPFSARVNSTFLTSGTQNGSYATYLRSAANTADVKSFDVTVTATTASGSSYDQLTVQDYQGNVYHYRVHVSAARVVKKNRTETATANAYHAGVWIPTVPSASSTYVSATASPATATDSATVTFTGKAATASPVTVQVSNYEGLPTTGALGATYTYSMTVIDPPTYTYYARVATVVVGATGSGIGQGWAYASRKRQEDSEVYQTTRSVSEVGSVTLYENVASAEVDGFYLFAFPNMGYKFTGWSVGSPTGEIISTEAFSASGASVSVTASSKTLASPTEVTYYAHFEKDDSKVRDITLGVGDSVRLYFNNTTACNWSLQVVYTNGTEQVVNLDDTATHAGGYANYTRSASTAPASASTAFNMFVQATKASGNDFDQLTIEDYAGNVYHYRVHVVDRRVIEQHDTALFQADSFATNVWTHSAEDGSVLTVSVQPIGVATNSAKVHATGVAKCKDSRFTVSNYAAAARTGELGAVYEFGMNVVEPWPVNFCQGDQVVIYYHNTVAKNWYLLINGNRVEPNVAGVGTQMTVTLSADNPDCDTEILGVARSVGATGTSDLVIVTDGENFYPYRMAVEPRRVIGIGESKSMTCSTVATYPWRIQVPSSAAFYVDTDFSPDEEGGHSATVTITGKRPGKNVTLYVANFYREDQTVNAQGAYYTLVTDVVGAYTRGVYMSQGTSVTWGEDYLYATDETRYSVTPAVSNLMTAAIASNNADTVFTTLATPSNAVPMTTALFEVKDQAGADVVKYDVMAYGIMSMAVGQVAPGCLTGSAVPWVVVSSDPAKLSAEPTVYNKLNSGRIEAKAPGDFSIWATNGNDQVYWYSIRAQVYDETEQLITLPVNGTTNIVVSSQAGLEAVWNLTKGCEHLTATLDNTTNAADHVTVTLRAGTVEGTHVMYVNNAFHHETLKIFVGANPGQQVVIAGSLKFTAGNTVSMPGDAPPAAWTAQLSESAAGAFSLVKTSGAAGEAVQVYGNAPGTGQVIVKTASTIYVYEVEVAKNDGKLSDITVGVGYMFTTNLTDFAAELAGATLYQAPDSMIATAYVMGNQLVVNGVQDGKTSLKLATSTYIYTVEIIVHERNIRKNITLYTGDNGTSTSYSYTFDRLVDFTNMADDRLIVTRDEDTITITAKPNAEGIGGVIVEGFVDGLSETSTINYHVTILKEKTGYKVKEYDQGHIAYRDADVVREPDGDLVFVFTNVNSAGSIIIPDGYSARVDILAVGGGGGGGSVALGFGYGGGGGGAGGYSSVTNKKMTAGTFGVQVGPGGLGLSSEIGGGESLPGSNGGASLVTNSFGYVIAAGNGGGGGAAPSPLYYSGLDGGSGGGGSWISNEDTLNPWIAGRGGLGISGQGCDGGTPTETNCGGGGGGANGNGGDGQTRGPGRYSDISGVNTLYSLGGYGGRSDKDTPAAAGQGPGFGGDGGNGGPGGNGGDGAVVIRFHKLYQNVLVPIPTTNDIITARFQWEEGTNYVPIVYEGRSFRSPSNAHPYEWAEAFDKITGVTNVLCYVGGDGGTNKVGIGYYNFYLTLKDGFAWDDGSTYGSLEKMRYRWVIVENWSDIDADINVHKTVWWSDKSNATIRVNSIASPEMSGGGIPKVLFLGSLCHAHSLAASTIVASLNAITERADVDYYLYQNGDLRKSGTLGMNDVITEAELNVTLNYSSHSSLRAFYERLYQDLVLDGNAKKYDYIVMEFDGSRIAKYYVNNNDNKSGATIYAKFDHEEDVAQALVPFYEKDGVIWIVDNGDEKSGSVQYPVDEPFGHTSDPWTQNKGHSDLNEYWRPNTYLYSSGHLIMTDTQYQGLIGLFDPKHYLAGSSVTAAQMATTNTTYAPRVNNGQSGTSATYYGNDRNELQAHYEDPEAVTNLLGTAIKVKPFNLYYLDKIVSPSEGLTIQDVYIQVCTTIDGDGAVSTNDTDWVNLMHWVASTGQYYYDDPQHLTGIPGGTMEVNTTSNLVQACLSNINFKVGVRYDTHVLDAEGKFQTSDGANYNEQTGQYEKNPNEGAAQVSLVDDFGVGIGVEGDAETEVPWRYTAYKVGGTAQNGSIYVAGTQYSTLSCPEGHDVTVYYRGNGGYRLTALRVDGNSIEVGTGYDNAYTFHNLQADHTVQAIYTAYYGTVTNLPTTFQYDGVAHVPDVELNGWDASYDTQIRYALSADGPYYTEEEFAEMYSTNRDVTCVGEHEVYTRVYAYQEGYGTNLTEKGWVWVDTRVVEKGSVTITQKPLIITANSFNLSASQAPRNPPLTKWEGVSVSGLVAGDTVNTNDAYLTFSCPDYAYAIAQYRIDPVYQSGVTAVDVAGNNYIVYLRPGVVSVIRSPMIIGGITQFSARNPEEEGAQTGVDRVEITYNGVATNLVIRVDDPTGLKAEDLIFKYSIDDGQTWTSTLPTRLHVGTNKVWYAVEDGTDWENANYFSVTNYNYLIVNPRPITITAASATKRYDGTPLSTNDCAITAGSLAEGDAVTAITVTGSRTNVGTTPNVARDARIEGANAGVENMDRTFDYAITYVDGAITITPGAIQVDGFTYEPGVPTAYGYQYSGVRDVEKYYDGIGTNIDVNVVVPASGYHVFYTTNQLNDANLVWHSYLSLVDAGTYPVNFLIQADNYADVTNVARVIIHPREFRVEINDACMRKGDPLPEFTAIVYDEATGLVVPQDVLDLLDIQIGPTNTAYQAATGDYDLVLTSAAVQGNFKLNYVPGTLTVDNLLTIPYEVDNPIVTYDGDGHSIGITVDETVVTAPYEIKYALSPDGPWSRTVPVVTNATSGTPIYYAIESSADYRAVTNVAVMAVNPYPVTVTTESVTKLYGEFDPEYTATVSPLVDADTNKTGLITYTFTREPGETSGTYEVTATGAAQQGNYAVTYVPATLTIIGYTSLWICDHEDAGSNRVHLAFKPTTSAGNGPSVEAITNLASRGLIRVAMATNETEFVTAVPQAVPLRDPTAQLDFDKGWIWVTVDLGPHLDKVMHLWKVLIAK